MCLTLDLKDAFNIHKQNNGILFCDEVDKSYMAERDLLLDAPRRQGWFVVLLLGEALPAKKKKKIVFFME